MTKVSIGTAIELGLSKGMLDIAPTTAYLMIGEKCDNKCAFCSQSVGSTSGKNKLSRVIWPQIDNEIILKSLKNYNNKSIKRICLQVMGSDEALKDAKEFIKYVIGNIDMPISVSAKVECREDVEDLLRLGVQKIGIAIDGANEVVYKDVKGKNFKEKVEFVKALGLLYPEKISTHIIVGLGETHKDIFHLYSELTNSNVTVSLFAFTPVKGTKLEKLNPPTIENYRQVQLMTYLIKNGYNQDDFEFIDGKLSNVKNLTNDTKMLITKGIPFQISGCKDCNRPYYNERPGGTIYNYSRDLNSDECTLALSQLNLKI